jgi:RNA polymerase sigma factor (sigma-70 family)
VVSRPLDEAALVAQAKRGDAAAYEELVRMHQDIAFRTACVIARNAADAEEAAQDGFVKAYRALGRFREGAPFRPWLLRIVANEARNRRRTETRQKRLWARAVEEEVSGDAAPSPEASVVSAERRAELLVALETLRDDDRLVLACRYLAALTEHETAAALGLRRGTVKSRTARALGRLREVVGDGTPA